MKHGLALPYTSARKVADYAQLAEETDWDGVFLGDAVWTVDPFVSLAAAAMVTQRIRLGTMVVPVPLRKPWKLASEAGAVDNLSGGRLTLGLGAGAVWMGWQGFPDEVTDTRARAGMLDETIDILTLLFQGKPFDYDGKHFHLKLSLLDEQHYPPRPAQQPRIPLWVVGVWPRMKSMRRALKCDGLLPMKMNPEGKFVDFDPEDVRAMRAFIEAEGGKDRPFDIVVEKKVGGLDATQAREQLAAWEEAGATWLIEGLWGENDEGVARRIRQGPPGKL